MPRAHRVRPRPTFPSEKRRQGLLEEKRKREHEDFEKEKQRMAKVCLSFSERSLLSRRLTHSPAFRLPQETEKKNAGAERFVKITESMDERLKKSTVGLVNLKDFQATRKALEEEQAMASAQAQTTK